MSSNGNFGSVGRRFDHIACIKDVSFLPKCPILHASKHVLRLYLNASWSVSTKHSCLSSNGIPLAGRALHFSRLVHKRGHTVEYTSGAHPVAIRRDKGLDPGTIDAGKRAM